MRCKGRLATVERTRQCFFGTPRLGAGTVQARPWAPGAAAVVTAREPMPSVIDAYKEFDLRHPGWIKVALIALREGGVG